jgi:hypothetical protein
LDSYISLFTQSQIRLFGLLQVREIRDMPIHAEPKAARRVTCIAAA